MGKPLIELRDITKVFGGQRQRVLQLLDQGLGKEEIREKTGANVGVNRVSLDVYEGELFVIMGLSGSGKSTLLRCLNRLIEPTKGSLVIEGQDIISLDKNQLLKFRQQKTAMVFQNFALFPHRTVVDNVAYGLEIQNVPRPERLKVAEEQLAVVGLEGWGDQYPGNLSGGMQQRVGLARALANDPDILLMDEAFSALDPLIRDDMQNELLNLQQKLKKTIVFITHDLNEALKLGDRIALMKDGAVVQIGTPEEIITQPANDYVKRFVQGVDVTKVFTAQDVMKRPSPLVRLKDGPSVALRTLRDAGLSSAFVVDKGGTLSGVILADDLVQAVKNKVPSVGQCELHEAASVPLDTTLDDLVPSVVQSRFPVAVVDEENNLKGLIFKSAILEAMANEGGEADADSVAEDTASPLG
ncbi:glycine betaine/L-proline ABC transporter ATP-binding protein [Alicyclobacillus sp. SO9]|uniref:quaternary amine ABC transporter ATP-binding protein n=1 Tax=Alicyclobacillus sp. SO9 TaxID=2665646 RepID=UPI0018E6F0D7|nr:glycine betaine/L-proline ABC transporter ATP-binding protein [Alicyclobacillus sp. SO9]QQE78603.1 glycine betaine/L-proline ABC transporter ATP-binding protein [Alicyclobacillus sp. SO9]